MSLAFVFPGQGSQKVGMLSEFTDNIIVRETYKTASDVLGYDLWALSQNGPQDALNMTEVTQPLLLTASVALWRLWRDKGGPLPTLMAGHSLGEFSALVCAEVIDFADAVDLVRKRGQFMQAAVPVGVGAMAAIIGLDDDQVDAACAAAAQGECVSGVNYNSPGQVVIAGHAAAVDRAIVACKEAGAKRGLPLPVSAPFHTDLMRPAGEALAKVVEQMTFSSPIIPVIHNVTVAPESDPAVIKSLVVEQIFSPVPWTQCIQYMASQGVSDTVECGAGKVLGGLNKRIEKSLNCFSTDTEEALNSAIEALSA
ncbi:MAG TPA: ACP S-malonyltransferase [Pseudomonadales bacterium]|nr:ACP S-malonyltransferase [Pseudomonadales bacterium]